MSSEHIDINAKVNPKEAISELLWNACDADATRIDISLSRSNHIDEAIEEIVVKDNGHGLRHEDISDFLGFYGRSNKTYANRSPSGRLYHGKNGNGRYKSFSIGTFIKWESIYAADDGQKYSFSIEFVAGNKTECAYSAKELVSDDIETGLVVTISGITENPAILSNTDIMREEIITSFAAYLTAYNDIEIRYDSYKIEPNDFIQEHITESLEFIPEGEDKRFAETQIILWKTGFNKDSCKLYICGQSGVTYDICSINHHNQAVSVYLWLFVPARG